MNGTAHRLGLLLSVAAIGACRDFSSDFAKYCDRTGACDGGSDSGVTLDAGLDGGYDAGATTPTDGATDAGSRCPAPGCASPVLFVGNYVVSFTFDDAGVATAWAGDHDSCFAARLDGGAWDTRRYEAGVTQPGPPQVVLSPKPGELLLVTQWELYFIADGQVRTTSVAQRCGTDANGLTTLWQTAALASPDEGYIAGYFGALCRWSRDAGFEPLRTARLGEHYYSSAVLRDGGLIVGDDQWQVGPPDQPEPSTLRASITSLAAVADTIWAASSAGAYGRGGFAVRRPDGGWVAEQSLLVPITGLLVNSENDVWVGTDDQRLLHFDGGSWQRVAYPTGVPATATVYAIHQRGNQLFLGGNCRKNAADVAECGGWAVQVTLP